MSNVFKIISVIIVICCCALIGCEKSETSSVREEITGSEWLLQQDGNAANIKKIIDSVEEVYSLYVSGNMSSSDFLTELEIIQQQLFYYQEAYQTQKGEYAIVDIDEISKEGITNLEALFTDINDLLTASVDSFGDAYSSIEVSYIYLNYKEVITDDYIYYETAVKFVQQDSEVVSE